MAARSLPPSRDLSRDAVIYFVARAIPALLQFGTIVLFARLLGPHDYGLYVLIAAGSFSIAEVLSQWAQQAMVRFYPQRASDPAAFRRSLSLALVLVAGASGVVGVLAAVVAVAFGLDLVLTGLAIVLVTSTCIFNLLRAYFQAALRPHPWAVFSILNSGGRLALALAFIPMMGATVTAFLLAAAVTQVVLLIPLVRSVENGALLLAGFTRTEIRRWWTYGWPLTGWSACLQVLVLADRYLIAAFRGSYAAGVYSSIYDLANRGLYPVVDAVVLAVQPMVMHAGHAPERVRALIARGCRYIMLFIVPLVALSIVDGERALRLILGEPYAASYRILPVLLAGFLAWHLASTVQKTLEVTNRTRTVLLAVGTAAGANLVLSVPLIVAWGIVGAAVATLLSYAWYFFVVSVASARALQWRFPLASASRIAAASAASALTVVALRFLSDGLVEFGIGLCIGAIVYLAVLVALRELDVRGTRSTSMGHVVAE